jgi:imidazolonepropionase-like amidohydrolase
MGGVKRVATYVANVTLFDGRSTKRKAGVLVTDGHVEWVGSHARAPRRATAAEEIDGTGDA